MSVFSIASSVSKSSRPMPTTMDRSQVLPPLGVGARFHRIPHGHGCRCQAVAPQPASRRAGGRQRFPRYDLRRRGAAFAQSSYITSLFSARFSLTPPKLFSYNPFPQLWLGFFVPRAVPGDLPLLLSRRGRDHGPGFVSGAFPQCGISRRATTWPSIKPTRPWSSSVLA
jgi:hypothetical protein